MRIGLKTSSNELRKDRQQRYIDRYKEMMEDKFDCWFYKGNNQRRKCKRGTLQFDRDVGLRFVVDESGKGFRKIFGFKSSSLRVFAIPMRDLLKVKRCKERENTLVLYTKGSTRIMEVTAPSLSVMTKWEMTLNESIDRERSKRNKKTTISDIRMLIAKDNVGTEYEAFMRETSTYKAGYVRAETCMKGKKLDLAKRPWSVYSLTVHSGRGEYVMKLLGGGEGNKREKIKHSLQDTTIVAIDPSTGNVMKDDQTIDMNIPLVVAILPLASSTKKTEKKKQKQIQDTRRRSSVFRRLASFSFGRGGQVEDLFEDFQDDEIMFLSCPHHRLPISSRPSDVLIKTEAEVKKDPFPLSSILTAMSFSGSKLSAPLEDYVGRAEKMSISPPISPTNKRRKTLSPRHRRASALELSMRRLDTLPENRFCAVALWEPVWEDEHAAHVSHSCSQVVFDGEQQSDVFLNELSKTVLDTPPLLAVSKTTIEQKKPPICVGHWSVGFLKNTASSNSSTLYRVLITNGWLILCKKGQVFQRKFFCVGDVGVREHLSLSLSLSPHPPTHAHTNTTRYTHTQARTSHHVWSSVWMKQKTVKWYHLFIS